MPKLKTYLFKHLWNRFLKDNAHSLKYALQLVEETPTMLRYTFEQINTQMGLEMMLDNDLEIMITFDNPMKERMGHIVLVWEPYDVYDLSRDKLMQWFYTIVNYSQTFFTEEHRLVICHKPEHYSHANIVHVSELPHNYEIFPLILK